jgi:hypothetical protein
MGNIYDCKCCYNHCHENAVKGFGALRNNTYDVGLYVIITVAVAKL